MPFLSLEFALFFVVFLPIYWACDSVRKQNLLLLFAGFFWLFYLNILYALVVFFYGVVLSFIAHRLHESLLFKVRRRYFLLGIIFSLLMLCFFKYYDFFRAQLPLALQGRLFDILLPLGISYYTFQSIAYLVALYRQQRVYLGLRDTLLHLSFFVTITSGPIFRVDKIKTIDGWHEGAAVQLKMPRQILRPALALSLILLGVLKKWVWAAWLADGWVNPVFANPYQYDSFTILSAIYGYTAQLFFDFSGYTDLAIGLAMLLGFQLPPNFRAPLLAHNIRDFWNRWHISLSTWIRDYIYIPLGGSKKGFVRTQVNLLLAMALSGIWHGYGFNFLLWGLLHGVALVALNMGDLWCGKREALSKHSLFAYCLAVFFTLNFVCFSFVFFRASSFSDAMMVFTALFNNNATSLPLFSTALMFSSLFLALLFYQNFIRLFNLFVLSLERLPIYSWSLIFSALLFVIALFAPSGIPGFIYANF